MLQVKQLNKSYKNKQIIIDCNFEVRSGEILTFLGASGSGKSTLLKILNGLEVADSGELFLSNVKLNFSDIGLVFQDFNLFKNLTVGENIAVPLLKIKKYSMQGAAEMTNLFLKRFNLLEHKNKYPDELSGGQKQRVALARSLVLNPKIICLDEPTSSLDPLLKKFVAESIKELQNNKLIVIIATHDIEFLKQIDTKIALLENGKIVEFLNSAILDSALSVDSKIKNFINGLIATL